MSVVSEAKKLLNVDRGTLWIIDQDRNQLWTKIQKGDDSLLEIQIPREAGFAGQVAMTGEPLLIPFDFYNHSNSQIVKKTDWKTGYRTCSALWMPIFSK